MTTWMIAVHRLDLSAVLGVDHPPLELQRRRQLLGLGRPLGRQDCEALELLHPRKVAVRLLQRAPHLADHRWVVRLLGRRPGIDTACPRPSRRGPQTVEVPGGARITYRALGRSPV